MKPTGQEWKNWKRARWRQRIKLGLPGNPPNWELEWEMCGKPVQPNSQSTNRERSSCLDSEEVRLLQMEVESLKKTVLSEASVREVVLGLAKAELNQPGWTLDAKNGHKMNGVPTLFLSDLHWGEVVNPSEIGGVNEYNLEIAHQRLERCFDTTTKLLRGYFKEANYPGIVIALGGDMLSGDIHDELKINNATSTMQSLIDLRDCLVNCVSNMADEFGKVFLPCVAGNHGRLDKKPVAKGRAYTNWDWLLYQLLDKAFQNDPRVHLMIPSGPDANYRIYGTRFCLTHGDQFRGGDGMIGHLGPLVRGDHKKRSRNNQINQGYDILLLGHFHTLMMAGRFISNGSLIGYNEYAYQGNFSFEEPRQALFITHKDKGVVWQMPVNCGEPVDREANDWVSVFR